MHNSLLYTTLMKNQFLVFVLTLFTSFSSAQAAIKCDKSSWSITAIKEFYLNSCSADHSVVMGNGYWGKYLCCEESPRGISAELREEFVCESGYATVSGMAKDMNSSCNTSMPLFTGSHPITGFEFFCCYNK